ncbi:type II and III secretion system protein family protein [Sphingorhabdus lutea]|nr:type II and III secretion system protein family protein [Sphingorhabdus lutea]
MKTRFLSSATAMAMSLSVLASATIALPFSVSAQAAEPVLLSIGNGKQVNLTSAITDIVVADPRIADVDVKSPRQIYIFGKAAGETTVYATNAAGKTVYQVTIRVGQNIENVDDMFALAMPDAQVNITKLNGVYLLTGTVAQPEDAAEAESLLKAFSGDVQVVNRLKTATPMQVNLQVRIAEVSRSLSKAITSNLVTRDNTNGFQFGLARGRNAVTIGDVDTSSLPLVDASSNYGLPAGSLSLPFDPATGQFVTGGRAVTFNNPTTGASAIAGIATLFGMDVGAALDASEQAGLITTLAQPNLTTVSGETANFLAGGQFPIPVSSGLGSTSVEFRNYGVSLTYTPTVLSDGRISLRVKPEVSDISSQGAVRINGLEIPALTTRTVETTVELGSGQSFMIGGLISNSMQSSVDKMPGAGDIPILGSLFKSNGWRKNETELMIIVTPYLVKPVSESEIVLPTDGFESPNDLERLLLGKVSKKNADVKRPGPTVQTETVTDPGFNAPPQSSAPVSGQKNTAPSNNASTPGFSFNN